MASPSSGRSARLESKPSKCAVLWRKGNSMLVAAVLATVSIGGVAAVTLLNTSVAVADEEIGGTSVANAINADALDPANAGKPGHLNGRWSAIESTLATTDSEGGARVTGYAVIADNSTNAANGGDNTGVPAGTAVYLQWIDQDGSVSPIYTAKTYSADESGAPNDGAYAFAVPPWTDSKGEQHFFLPGIAFQPTVHVWVEPYTDPETGSLVVPLREADKNPAFNEYNYGGGSTYLDLQYLNNYVVFSYITPPQGFATPEAEWVDASTRSGDAYYVSGKVWFEEDGSAVGTGPNSGGDSWATGYRVVFSSLTNEGYAAVQAADLDSTASLRDAAAWTEFIQEHPEYIAETVYSDVSTDGDYKVIFTDQTYEHNALYGYVLDPNGNVMPAYSSFTSPRFIAPSTYGTVAPPTSAPTANGWYNTHFALVPYIAPTLNITNFDTAANPAAPGDTAEIDVTGTLSQGGNSIVWADQDGNEVKRCDDIATVADAEACAFTVPDTASPGTVFTAKLVNADNVLSADSFVVQAEQSEAEYTPVTFIEGEGGTVPEPQFKDGAGNSVEKPAGVTFEVGADVPSWATVHEDGTITVATEAPVGETQISVVVTYENGSTDTIPASVNIVTDDDGDGGAKDPDDDNDGTADDPAATGDSQHVTFGVKINDQVVLSDGDSATANELPESIRDLTVRLTAADGTTFTSNDNGATWRGTENYPVVQNFGLSDIPAGTYTVTVNGEDDAVDDGLTLKADSQLRDGASVEITGNTPNLFVEFTRDAVTDAERFSPDYVDVTVPDGAGVTIAAPVAPEGALPDGTTFAQNGEAPAGVTVNSDGSITVDAENGLVDGANTVTVTVTYPDQSTEVIDVAITQTTEGTTDPNWEDTTTGPTKPVDIPNTGGEVPEGTTVEVDGPGSAVIGEGGTITVTPGDGAKPGDTITVTVKDGEGSVIDEFTVTIGKPGTGDNNGAGDNSGAKDDDGKDDSDKGGNGLANTGAEGTGILAAIAAALLAMGTVLLGRGRSDES